MVISPAIKILMIEDDKEDYLITRDMLSTISPRGYQVDWEPDFASALQKIELNAHDIYLVDYNLGAQSGVDLIKQVQRIGSDLPFVFLTGMNDLNLDLEAMEAGAVDYLVKNELTPQILERSIRYSLKQKENEKALRNANSTKDKLFSIISHDLRSPISTLITTIDAMTNNTEIDNDVKNELLMELGKISKSTLSLLENLMVWSRNQRELFAFQPSVLDPRILVDSVFELHQQHATQKAIKLRNNVKPSQQLTYDENVFKLILRNLLSNAIKFTETGGEVAVRSTASEDFFQFEVSDTGIGMDQETRETILQSHIFNTNSGTNNESGSGLGLKIVKDFVTKYKGNLWFDSVPGEGTVFYFTIPRNQAVEIS